MVLSPSASSPTRIPAARNFRLSATPKPSIRSRSSASSFAPACPFSIPLPSKKFPRRVRRSSKKAIPGACPPWQNARYRFFVQRSIQSVLLFIQLERRSQKIPTEAFVHLQPMIHPPGSARDRRRARLRFAFNGGQCVIAVWVESLKLQKRKTAAQLCRVNEGKHHRLRLVVIHRLCRGKLAAIARRNQPIKIALHNSGLHLVIARDEPLRRRHILRSEEHTSELQSLTNLVCRLLLEKKKTRPRTKPRFSRLTRAPRPSAD